jgi:hypothetical protein
LTLCFQCGGFLADKWLGAPEPDSYAGNLTPSQRKVCTFIPTCLTLAYFFFQCVVSRHDCEGMGLMGIVSITPVCLA